MTRLEGKEAIQDYLDRQEAKKRSGVRNSDGFTVSGDVFVDVVNANSRLAKENASLRAQIARMERKIASVEGLNRAFIDAAEAFYQAGPKIERTDEQTETTDKVDIVDVQFEDYRIQ